MGGPRFKVFRGSRTRSAAYDGDTADGVGAELRACIPIPLDEGDERMRELIEKLREIEGRPNAPPSEPTLI